MSDNISAKLVGELRQKTGAGLMDCKAALAEAGGDLEKAGEVLRKKGIAKADKKADREASEGTIQSYIHMGGKVGVLVEINCETDFVGKNEEFVQLAKDICMHIAATRPLVVNRDQVPQDILEKEREIARAQAEGKPPQAIQKIVEGKMEKYFSEVCLMEQSFVKRSDVTIEQLIKEAITKLGENIVIRRFARFQLGED